MPDESGSFLSIKPHVSVSKNPVPPQQEHQRQAAPATPQSPPSPPVQEVKKIPEAAPVRSPLAKPIEIVPPEEIASPPTPVLKPVKEKHALILEPMDSSAAAPADASFKKFLREHFPNYPLSDTVPSDHLARKARDAWLIKHQILPVIILSFDEQNQTLAFLKNIAKAISLCLAPACVLSGAQLEKEQQWDRILSTPDLRLIIACDYELYLQPGLMQYYKPAQPATNHYLKETPLLLLSDLSLYLKKPELKSLLWNVIQKALAVEQPQTG